MWAIYKKEINQFFSGIVGYVSLLLFWVACGLLLFVFPDTNILNDGYATLDQLFSMAPWIFLLLIPAVTMRAFSEEFRSGTMELLYTKPVSDFKIIAGKYIACVTLVVIALIPTFFYYITISHFTDPGTTLDNGGILGSYIGLILLGATFTSIGVWTSSLTQNTVVAFLLSVFVCFIFYTGFDAISKLPAFQASADYYIQMLGISFHYNSISRGVIDTRDVTYFGSVIILFLLLSRISLQQRKWT
jgi:gliding motility-associated transport system permease protein